ncbi:MAG: ABC transporter substrate-binding protein [Deltaproteobacteria bacterium]|nr:ABC transporter substrate-binding protein [Deltaproteobacteria bacterium]
MPQRIVSLKPNITEILFALGVGDRVVGVTTWCDFPAAARALPKVADYVRPNLEAILALRPDLVIASRENSLRAPIERLSQWQIPVLLTDFTSVESLRTAITAIATRVGAEPAGARLTQQIAAAIAPPPTAATPAPRVLLLVGHYPPVAAGPASLLGELLRYAGAQNVITAPQPLYPQLSREQLLALQPDVILDAATSMEGVSNSNAKCKMQNTKCKMVDIDLLRAGPRVAAGIAALRDAIAAATEPEPTP